MPEISVVTALGPSDVDFLAGAYRSLLFQDLEDWEWILSLDGDIDVDRFRSSHDDPRIRYVQSLKNGGPAAARNLALSIVESPIFRNLDADDELPNPTVLTRTLAIFAQNPGIEFACGSMLDLLESGETKDFQDALDAGLILKGSLFRGWLENDRFGLVHPTSLSVRVRELLRVGGYPAVAAGEDTALLFVLNGRGDGWFDGEKVTLHRKRSGSITEADWYHDSKSRGLRDNLLTRIGDSYELT